ncbi:MAG TPA: DUF362 domain-containing protein [Syntrophobacteraceae bacterium]|nr:DUF362 domain-containing protein [Syntrophobacteraceae bacterium]
MEEMSRRDFVKTTAVVAGVAALGGVPGVLRAMTKTAVAVVQSDMDLGGACKFDMSVWGDDTAKSKQKLGLMEMTWTPESMAEVEKMLRSAIKLTGGLPVKKGDTVIIKPNVVQTPHLGFFLLANYSAARALATISDPRVVIAAAKIAREQGAKTVIIAESNASNCHSFFQESGYETGVAALKDPAVKLLYLDGTSYKMMKPKKAALALPQYAIFDAVEKADTMISVAPMKTHMWAGTTMTMKNFVGLPANKVYGSYKSGLPHSNIADVIVDLTSIAKERIKSHYGIVTGIYAGEGLGPLQVDAKALNTIVAGPDYVAVDAVGSTIMGFDAAAIGHIRKAYEKGLGNMKGIEVVGTPIEKVQFAAKPIPEAARQKGGENNSWDSMVGRKLPV